MAHAGSRHAARGFVTLLLGMNLALEWAREHQRVILTHDIGFSALLASSRSMGPSVVLLRTQDKLPATLAEMLIQILHEHRQALTGGAILSVDESASRVRILPLGEAPARN